MSSFYSQGSAVFTREVSDKMERIAKASGAPGTYDELRSDLLGAGATPEQADEYIRERKIRLGHQCKSVL